MQHRSRENSNTLVTMQVKEYYLLLPHPWCLARQRGEARSYNEHHAMDDFKPSAAYSCPGRKTCGAKTRALNTTVWLRQCGHCWSLFFFGPGSIARMTPPPFLFPVSYALVLLELAIRLFTWNSQLRCTKNRIFS